MENISPINKGNLKKVNGLLSDANLMVSMSMAYIKKIQGWSYGQLEERFSGISKTTWARYLQPSYTKMRPLHVVAAYSWLTMVPMPSFYRGLKIKEAYRGMDDESVEAMIHCGVLPKKQFRLVLDYLYEYLPLEKRSVVDQFVENIRNQYGLLDDYENKEFMFPKQLDMESFAYDYYRSVALALKEFREINQLSVETTAKVLNLSEYRYQQCENPDNSVPLPVDIAARLKLGFKLTDAMPFTAYMKEYPQFHTVRIIQHIRETILVEFMRYCAFLDKKNFINVISEISLISNNIRIQQEKLELITARL